MAGVVEQKIGAFLDSGPFAVVGASVDRSKYRQQGAPLLPAARERGLPDQSQGGRGGGAHGLSLTGIAAGEGKGHFGDHAASHHGKGGARGRGCRREAHLDATRRRERGGHPHGGIPRDVRHRGRTVPAGGAGVQGELNPPREFSRLCDAQAPSHFLTMVLVGLDHLRHFVPPQL